jgi:hypothetical protein
LYEKTKKRDVEAIKKTSIHFFAAILVFSVAAGAAVIRVPEDHATIQSGIDAAADGDTVSVADGVYESTGIQNDPVVDFNGKAITVGSRNGPAHCILSGGYFPAYFHHSETNASILSGFTIRNGDPEGGVGCVNHSSPTIFNNVITGNWSEYGMGAVFLHDSSQALVIGNVIHHNGAYGECAGIYCCHHSNAVIINNTIVGNRGGGYAFSCGIYCDTSSGASMTLMNCIIRDNGDFDLYGCAASYSCLEHDGAGAGNIFSYPQFADSADFRYSITENSPCIDAGSPDTPVPVLPERDAAGHPRISGGRIDIGAYEYQDASGVRNADHPPHLPKSILCQNYPNPFNSGTGIRFSIAVQSRVTLSVFDLSGVKVRECIHRELAVGFYDYHLDMTGLSSGEYIYRLNVGDEALSNKLLLIK